MSAKIKYALSAAVLALIAAGASAPQILDQFLDEKEGTGVGSCRTLQ
ncbi:lysozyme, partial [Escherichia coli]